MTMARQTHPLGLYLHIPFCRSKCAYCDFYSLSGREDRMDAYTAALERHLIEVAPQAAQHLVDTVYFGGGAEYRGRRDRHVGVPCIPVGVADGTGTLPPAGPVRRGRDAGTHHGLCQRRGVPGAGFQG